MQMLFNELLLLRKKIFLLNQRISQIKIVGITQNRKKTVYYLLDELRRNCLTQVDTRNENASPLVEATDGK